MPDLITDSLDRALCDGAVLLTVNRRLARAYMAAFHNRRLVEGAKTWRTPSILPFESWLKTLYQELSAAGCIDLGLLNDEQERFVWQGVLEASNDSSALLSLLATSASLAGSFRIEEGHRCLADLDGYYVNEDQRFYVRWSTSYRSRCLDAQVIDAARLPDYLLSVLQGHQEIASSVLPKHMVIAGFSAMTPQYRQFIEELQALGVRVEPDYQAALINSVAGRVICPDAEAELLSCARWARNQLQTSFACESKSTIGVVIPDLHQRRSEVMRVFDGVFYPGANPLEIENSGRPFDISLGKPLSQYAPISHALLILEFGFNRLVGNEISQFLLSPYLEEYLSEKNDRAALDATLRDAGVRNLTPNSLLEVDAVPDILHSLTQRLVKAYSKGRAKPTAWLKRFIVMLDAVGWPGAAGQGNRAVLSAEYQAIEAWRECVDSVSQLDDLVGGVTVRDMLMIVRQLSTERIFQPQSADVPIQIMGSLESQGLQFQALWVTGMDNETWPLKVRRSAFLPYQWQKIVGAPGASNELTLSLARNSVAMWRDSAETVVFSYPATRSGNPVSPSIHIVELDQIDCDALTPDGHVDALEVVFGSVSPFVEWLDDLRGPATDIGARIKGGARLFEDQASCPFRAFALHRLSIRTLEEPVLGIDAREKGNFFHNAMQFFWDQTGDHTTLVTLSDEGLLNRVREAISDAMADAWHESPELLALEQSRLEQVIVSWINEFEVPRDGFSVEMTEATHEFEFETLGLRLQVDRVDQLTDGGRIIIDYKTGKNNSPASWAEDRITSAQLPLYAVLLKDVQAICFAQVAVNQNCYRGMASEKGLLPGLAGPSKDVESWDDQLDNWQHKLELLAAEIREGYAAVNPHKSACNYCRLPALCRVSNDTLISSVESSEPASPYGRSS